MAKIPAMGKMLLGMASPGELEDILRSFGAKIETREVAANAVEIIRAFEPVIRGGIESSGRFVLLTASHPKYGRLQGLILAESGVDSSAKQD